MAADRHRNSTRARRICLETHRKVDAFGPYMLCRCGRELRPDCGQIIHPAKGETWRAHHNIPWAEGGEDTPENLYPILTACDVETTAPEDTARIAKNHRIRDRRDGVKRPSRPMPGSKNSPWKKHMDGRATRR